MPPFFDVQLLHLSPSYRLARQALRYVPQQLISKSEFYRGEGRATVLHMSAVGNNLSCQQNVAAILQSFHAIAPLQAVMMEELSGDVDLTALRALPRPEVERFFEQGQLAPQAYFAVTTTEKLYLHGLEDIASIRQARQAQRLVVHSQQAVSEYLQQLESILNRIPLPVDPGWPLPLAQPKQWLKQLADLLKLGLVYQSWEKIEPLLERFGPGGFEAALGEVAPQSTAGFPAVPASIHEAAAQAVNFYRAAVNRGKAFADNALALLDNTQLTRAASSFTGFQATVYLERLRKAGVSYLHLTPKIELDRPDESVNLFEVDVEKLFASPKPLSPAATGEAGDVH
jgi:hypothetical protein